MGHGEQGKRANDAAMDNSERVKRGKGWEEKSDWKWQPLKSSECEAKCRKSIKQGEIITFIT